MYYELDPDAANPIQSPFGFVHTLDYDAASCIPTSDYGDWDPSPVSTWTDSNVIINVNVNAEGAESSQYETLATLGYNSADDTDYFDWKQQNWCRSPDPSITLISNMAVLDLEWEEN